MPHSNELTEAQKASGALDFMQTQEAMKMKRTELKSREDAREQRIEMSRERLAMEERLRSAHAMNEDLSIQLRQVALTHKLQEANAKMEKELQWKGEAASLYADPDFKGFDARTPDAMMKLNALREKYPNAFDYAPSVKSFSAEIAKQNSAWSTHQSSMEKEKFKQGEVDARTGERTVGHLQSLLPALEKNVAMQQQNYAAAAAAAKKKDPKNWESDTAVVGYKTHLDALQESVGNHKKLINEYKARIPQEPLAPVAQETPAQEPRTAPAAQRPSLDDFNF